MFAAGFPKIQSKPVQVVLLRKPQISSEDKVLNINDMTLHEMTRNSDVLNMIIYKMMMT